MHLASPLSLTARGWEQVTVGESGAVVLRSPDGSRYAKFVAIDHETVLAAERDRLVWAGDHGIPTARVLDWVTSDEWACLTTSAVPGVSADRLPAHALWEVWPSISRAVRRLHAIPLVDCPFRRGLAEMFRDADDVVERGAVNTQFLPPESRRTPPAEVLAQLRAECGERLAEQKADLVVCHGDLCLPNVLVDPESSAVTGFIDLGRLGRADRYADIALLLGNSRGTWSDESQANDADDVFATEYGITLNGDRRQFYLCLDALTWPTTA